LVPGILIIAAKCLQLAATKAKPELQVSYSEVPMTRVIGRVFLALKNGMPNGYRFRNMATTAVESPVISG
jgi:hypothetical protein